MDTANATIKIYTLIEGRSTIVCEARTLGFFVLDELLDNVEKARAASAGVSKSTPVPLWLRNLYAHCPRGYIFVQYNHLPNMVGIVTEDMPDSRLLALDINGRPYESLEVLVDTSPGTYDLESGKATRNRLATQQEREKVCESVREALLWLQGTEDIAHDYGLVHELTTKIATLRRNEELASMTYQRAITAHTETIVRLGAKHLSQLTQVQLDVKNRLAPQVDNYLAELGLTRKDLEELSAFRKRAKARATIDLEID